MLIGHEVFFHNLIGERTLWIKGQLGSYKTALAYRLAYELLSNPKYKYRHLVSNLPDVWSDRWEDIEVRREKHIKDDRMMPYADTVVILDEAGNFIRYKDDLEVFAALRKLNVLILCPSKNEPHRSIRTLRVYKKFDLHNFGIDGIVYGWRLRGDEEDDYGTFTWLGCSEIYGVYDTDWYPVDDEGIADWLVELKNELTGGRYEEKIRTRVQVGLSGMAGEGWEDGIGQLDEVVDDLNKSEKRLVSVLKKGKRRARY